ncbi:MAG: OmpH family outer membrane protein [Saprospiraceae bacterium]|nr:OmpH family outer membrane protein [Saprospiraceae bacterium]
MKLLNIILPVVLSLGLIVAYHFTLAPKVAKTAYVDINHLYSEFQMAKELDIKLKTVQNQRKLVLDSLGMTLDNVVRSKGESWEANAQLLQREYSLKQQQFSEDDARLSKQYYNQVATQLNQYVQDFSKSKGYEYIFGSANGSLMAANPSKDITKEVLVYINERYGGK